MMIVPDEKLLPLPVLPVERDEHCSQEMTDAIISELEKNYKDALTDVFFAENESRTFVHHEPYINIIADVMEKVSKTMPLPTDYLGLIDLAYELSRRIRKAKGLADIPTEGFELQDVPEWVLDERLSIDKDVALKILQDAYEANPELWFIYGEGLRRDMPLFVEDQLGVLITNHALTLLADAADDWRLIFALRRSAGASVMNACGLKKAGPR